MNLKYRANCVNISRRHGRRSAAGNSSSVKWLIYLLDYSHDMPVAIRQRRSSHRNFVGDETTQRRQTQLMFKLHSISILGEIWRRRMKVKLERDFDQ